VLKTLFESLKNATKLGIGFALVSLLAAIIESILGCLHWHGPFIVLFIWSFVAIDLFCEGFVPKDKEKTPEPDEEP
jgi:hypothetical protein